MTYCLALKLDEGLVFASDTRTNAGVDYVTAYGKMHVLRPSPDRIFVLLSAGNLAITTELVDTLNSELTDNSNHPLRAARYVFDAARYIGQLSRQVQDRHKMALSQAGISGDVSLILGGQIARSTHDLFLIYPQGNYISASPETPYLQIGESKYGKPMLDRILNPRTSLHDGARLALVSLDATVRSNLTVGAPFDLAIYRKDDLALAHNERIHIQTAFYRSFREAWEQGLDNAFRGLPRFEWEASQTQ